MVNPMFAETIEAKNNFRPLADRMRLQCLDDFNCHAHFNER